MILQHGPPSSANYWGCTTTRDDESARLVGLSRLLCHAVIRPLSGVLQASRDFRSSSCLCQGQVGTQCASDLATL
ncbi:hypothetical protein GW17_00058466 [Ensete ventricosum]|nr:hypothetical protein GW17_00058466 [Ensete ventricosum]